MNLDRAHIFFGAVVFCFLQTCYCTVHEYILHGFIPYRAYYGYYEPQSKTPSSISDWPCWHKFCGNKTLLCLFLTILITGVLLYVEDRGNIRFETMIYRVVGSEYNSNNSNS